MFVHLKDRDVLGIAPEQCVSVIEGLTDEDNGTFFAWDGQPIPW